MKNPLKQFRTLPPKVQRFTFLFSLSRFLWYFNFFWLVQNIYILDHGISYTQLSILLGVWSFGILVLEIPSGAFADRYGRKLTVVISRLTYLAGIIAFIVTPSFWGFLVGMVLWAVNESFMSGAEEALLYDYLKEQKHERLFDKALSFSAIAREIGLGTGVLIAGFVTQVSMQYNLIGSLIIATLGIIPVLLLEEANRHYMDAPELKYSQLFKTAVSKIQTNPNLRRILLFSMTTMLTYEVITQYFTVGLYELNIAFVGIGVLALLESGFYTLGSWLAQRLTQVAATKIYLTISLLMALLTGIIGFGTALTVIVGFLLLRTVKAIGEIYSINDWQKRVDSSDRATSTSFISFSRNAVYIPMAYVFGQAADTTGLFPTFYLMATFPLIFIFLTLVQSNKKKIR